jgi:HEAT repeat protein
MNETKTIRTGRTAIGLRLALVIAVLLIFFFAFPRGEPSYQGKPLSRWIRGLEYENMNPTDEQRTALRAMGEPAVSRLVEILEHRDSLLKRKFVAYSRTHPNIHNRFIARRQVIPEDVYHAEAATALGEIGPAARMAIPALVAATTNDYYIVRNRAKAALIKIREDSVAPLLQALNDPRSPNWTQAAQTAKYLGTNAQAAVPLLVKALQDTNVAVRQIATEALGGIASGPDLTVPALIECVEKETDPGVQRDAIDALCQFKNEKKRITPVLLSFMQNKNHNVWLGAAFGVEHLLSPEEKKTLYAPALLQSLNSPDEAIRVNAAMFLKRIDPAATKAGVK